MSVTKKTVGLPSGRNVNVPVNADGSVCLPILAKAMDFGRNRSYNDYEDRTDVVYPPNLTPRQAAQWLVNTDRADIEGLDVKGKPMRNVGNRTGENKAVHRKVDVYGLPDREEPVRKALDEAFSLEDRKKLVGKGRVEIEIRPLSVSAVGLHRGNNISLDRGRGQSNSVLVHEGVHHLRRVDSDRTSPLTKSFGPSDVAGGRNRDKDAATVEESCTVAEQMARQKGDNVTGYYYQCQVFDRGSRRWRSPTSEEAERMAKEDRKLFTNGTNKALVGDEAVRSVEKNWAKSNIARLKLGGRMAVNVMAASKPESKVKALGKTSGKPETKTTGVRASPKGKATATANRTRPRSRKK